MRVRSAPPYGRAAKRTLSRGRSCESKAPNSACGEHGHSRGTRAARSGDAGTRDGSKIVFADAFCNTCGESDLFVMNADGSGITQVTNSPENEIAKSWSRDGHRVVASFATVASSGAQAHLSKSDIAVIEIATGTTVNITNSPGVNEEDADWGP
jgi:Tol biopolymer transport system component